MNKTITEYNAILMQVPLFSGLDSDDIHAILSCLSAKEAGYSKGSFIHRYGDCIHTLGIVLSGSVHVLKEDFWGNTNLLSKCGPGDIFGESYAIKTATPLEVSIFASEPSTVLFLDISKLQAVCPNVCSFHQQLLHNLLTVLAEKNYQFSKKLEYITKRTTREKLLSYLSSESGHQNSSTFAIPFNRQQLADYLSVDRSAMSNELSRLKKEGIITFRKNLFTLNDLTSNKDD